MVFPVSLIADNGLTPNQIYMFSKANGQENLMLYSHIYIKCKIIPTVCSFCSSMVQSCWQCASLLALTRNKLYCTVPDRLSPVRLLQYAYNTHGTQ